MNYAPVRKGTLLIPSGPAHDPERPHLFVICTDPCAAGKQLLVPVCSRVNDLCDATCILQPHEHRFLNRESFAFYRKAKIEPQDLLVRGVAEQVFRPHDDLNGQSFLRVYNGICRSPQTSRMVRQYLGCE